MLENIMIVLLSVIPLMLVTDIIGMILSSSNNKRLEKLGNKLLSVFHG
jgi:hypothetical protein